MVVRRRREGGPRQANVAWIVWACPSPSGTDEEGLALLDGPLTRVLALVEAHPSAKLHLVLGGPLVDLLARTRDGVASRVRALWKEERIELLTAPWGDAVFGFVPDRDLVGQVRHLSNQVQSAVGRLPTGVWNPLRRWVDGVVDLVLEAGASWTLLDDVSFQAAGVPPEEVHGAFVAERLGRTIAVFPIHGAGSQAAGAGQVDTLAALLRQRSQPVDGAELLTVLAVPLDAGGLGAALEWSVAEGHWVKPALLSRVQGNAWRGVLRLPSAIDPTFEHWLRVPRSSLVSPRLLSTRAEPRRQVPRPVWESVLSKYPESNGLHKRMLRVSQRVDELRHLLQDRQSMGQVTEQDKKARKVLERACEGLWRTQDHRSYAHLGGEAGIYAVHRRQRAHRELLGVERLIDRVLGDPTSSGWSQQTADLDGDGFPDAWIRSRWLGCLFSPARGGALVELDLRERGLPLLTSLSPVEEPFHAGCSATGVRLVEAEEDTLPRSGDSEARALPDGLIWDGVRPGSFQDICLAPETTLRSYARRQFRDLADFSRSAWELLRVAGPGEEQGGFVQMGRSGVVRDVDRVQLVRVERKFQLDPDLPRMWVERTISNRSRDPAALWSALEWTLGIPSGQPQQVTLVVHREDGSHPASLDEEALDLGRMSGFEWVDPAADLAVVVRLDEPQQLWWAPVVTSHPGPEGWVETVQGHCFLLHGPVEVWGNDTCLQRLAIEFHRAGE